MIQKTTAILLGFSLWISVYGNLNYEMEVFRVFRTDRIYAAKSCGGAGQFVQWTSWDCCSPFSPCNVTQYEPSVARIQFLPSRNITKAELHAITSFGMRKSHKKIGISSKYSKLDAGIHREIAFGFVVSNGGQLGDFNLRYELHDLETGVMELCVEAPFRLVAESDQCKEMQQA